MTKHEARRQKERQWVSCFGLRASFVIRASSLVIASIGRLGFGPFAGVADAEFDEGAFDKNEPGGDGGFLFAAAFDGGQAGEGGGGLKRALGSANEVGFSGV